jgi:hypothetical protein
MLARSLAVAIATAALLAGCGTLTTQMLPTQVLPQDKRDQSPYACSKDPECYVQVYPYSGQWVPEYIYVDVGKKLDLWINNGSAEFEDPPITMKPGVDPILDCSEKNKLIVKCKVLRGDPTKMYGYTINVKGLQPYDPFIWPR